MADPDRIAQRLQQLWAIAHGPGGGADRPAYSPAEAEAMQLVAGWAAELELEPAIDAHGNLWALPAGDGPVVTAGSHVDTVPDGGRYDGALGTVLGLELAAALRERADERTATGSGVFVCAAEEAPRFSAGTIGSRLLTGALTQDALAQLRDGNGVSAADARDAYLQALPDLPRIAAGQEPIGRLRAHAEIHVATRFSLHELGVVARVASPRRLAITIDGESGHAGEVSMQERRDALAAAAEIMLEVERLARAEPPETVATVGTLEVVPGAISVIPCQVRLGVDMRAVDRDSGARLYAGVRTATEQISAARGIRAQLVVTRDGEPVELDQRLRQQALTVARELGISAVETWSGAGHDAQHINGLTPALLMFVPLHGGQSHTPQEGAEMSEVLEAATVAEAVLATVAS